MSEQGRSLSRESTQRKAQADKAPEETSQPMAPGVQDHNSQAPSDEREEDCDEADENKGESDEADEGKGNSNGADGGEGNSKEVDGEGNSKEADVGEGKSKEADGSGGKSDGADGGEGKSNKVDEYQDPPGGGKEPGFFPLPKLDKKPLRSLLDPRKKYEYEIVGTKKGKGALVRKQKHKDGKPSHDDDQSKSDKSLHDEDKKSPRCLNPRNKSEYVVKEKKLVKGEGWVRQVVKK